MAITVKAVALVGAMKIAAAQYREDEKNARTAARVARCTFTVEGWGDDVGLGHERVADQFAKQALECEALVEWHDGDGDLIIAEPHEVRTIHGHAAKSVEKLAKDLGLTGRRA